MDACTFGRRADVRVPCCEPAMFPKLDASRADQQGANLRFKDQKLAATIALPRRFRSNMTAEKTD